MSRIEPYVHLCVVQTGDAAGNKNRQTVDPYDIEFESECDVCGRPLAPLPKIIAHIYEQLTGDLS